MKINKLLFFLLAVFSLNSCVEYVDNGTKPDGPEKPEEQKFTAEQANPNDAKYVGDIFEFKAMLNGVDVTATTKFRVNGTNVPGKTYTPVKTGDHSVIATMDNFTANFKFKVLEEDVEPEPTGNRIDYAGVSNPLNTTYFILNGETNSQGQLTSVYTFKLPITGEDAIHWKLVNFDGTDPTKAKHIYELDVLMPFDGKNVQYPFQADPTKLKIVSNATMVNGALVPFTTQMVSVVFASTGNSAPTQSANGKANYTSIHTGSNSGEKAELFWNGEFILDIGAMNLSKGAKTASVKSQKVLKSNDTGGKTLRFMK